MGCFFPNPHPQVVEEWIFVKNREILVKLELYMGLPYKEKSHIIKF